MPTQQKIAPPELLFNVFVNLEGGQMYKVVNTNTRSNIFPLVILTLGCTAFHLACRAGDTACMDVLMKKDCDVYANDLNGFTGLDYVLKEDHVKCARYVFSETI